MKSPADILRGLPIVQDIISRHSFTPIVIVDVPASKYPDAVEHVNGHHCRHRWNAKKDSIAQTYSFEFEDVEDAFLFRMCI